MNEPTYENIAQRLSILLGKEVTPKSLRQFEIPTGSNTQAHIIVPNFTGFSGAFTRPLQDATFNLDLINHPQEERYGAQRIYYEGSRNPSQVVTETLSILLAMAEEPKKLTRRPFPVLDYNVY